jgi:hypothetical protein
MGQLDLMPQFAPDDTERTNKKYSSLYFAIGTGAVGRERPGFWARGNGYSACLEFLLLYVAESKQGSSVRPTSSLHTCSAPCLFYVFLLPFFLTTPRQDKTKVASLQVLVLYCYVLN